MRVGRTWSLLPSIHKDISVYGAILTKSKLEADRKTPVKPKAVERSMQNWMNGKKKTIRLGPALLEQTRKEGIIQSSSPGK